MRRLLILLPFCLVPGGCGGGGEPATGGVGSPRIAVGVGFTLKIPESLQPTPGSGTRGVLTYGTGKDSPFEPKFAASRSTSAIPSEQWREFALQRLVGMPQARVNRPSSHAPITIAGLPGFETIATGRHPTSGAELRIYQVMLFEKDGYIVMQGIAGEELAAKYEPEFMKIAHSLVRTRH